MSPTARRRQALPLAPLGSTPDAGYPARRPPRPWSAARRLAVAAAASLALAGCGGPRPPGSMAASSRDPEAGEAETMLAARAVDRDQDGIDDQQDRCPGDPEDRDGFEDRDGCYDPDNDADGLQDVDDLCPLDPEDRDGFEDEDGCPDPDNDQDRIADQDDRCPNEPETYNGTEDDDGCPDQGRVEVRVAGSMMVLDRIYFADGAPGPLSASAPVLDAIAATLQGNPQIRLVEIGGHADPRGRDRGDLALSRARAEAVVSALVARGVEPARLRAAGYGGRCPAAEGRTADGRARNRRVELHVVETDQGQIELPAACPPPRGD